MATPTDALIEKMARAMYELDAPAHLPWQRKNEEPLGRAIQEAFLRLARAAYSAEHEEDGK